MDEKTEGKMSVVFSNFKKEADKVFTLISRMRYKNNK